MYIERAFDQRDPADCFVITDDFVSAGSYQRRKKYSLSQLKINSFHMVEGRRLE